MTDPIVEAVIEKHKRRSEAGIKKYGVTMERKDVTYLQWLIHHQEELMDAAIYCERIIRDETKREMDRYSLLTSIMTDELPEMGMDEVLARSV